MEVVIAPDFRRNERFELDLGTTLTERYPWVDVVVQGEGEEPLGQLLYFLAQRPQSIRVWRPSASSQVLNDRTLDLP